MEDRPETLGTVIGMLKEGLHFGVNFLSKHFEDTDKSILSVERCVQERQEAILKAIAQNDEHVQHIDEKLDILMDWMNKTYNCAFNAEVVSMEMKQHLCPELYDREENKDD